MINLFYEFIKTNLKNRIFVQSQGGAKVQPTRILSYFEDLKRGTNTGFGQKDIFEVASKHDIVALTKEALYLII